MQRLTPVFQIRTSWHCCNNISKCCVHDDSTRKQQSSCDSWAKHHTDTVQIHKDAIFPLSSKTSVDTSSAVQLHHLFSKTLTHVWAHAHRFKFSHVWTEAPTTTSMCVNTTDNSTHSPSSLAVSEEAGVELFTRENWKLKNYLHTKSPGFSSGFTSICCFFLPLWITESFHFFWPLKNGSTQRSKSAADSLWKVKRPKRWEP